MKMEYHRNEMKIARSNIGGCEQENQWTSEAEVEWKAGARLAEETDSQQQCRKEEGKEENILDDF
jgi:hypothetical protein